MPEPHLIPRLDIARIAVHRVSFHEPGEWLVRHLGSDPRMSLTTTDWLTFPTQRLLEVTAGEVFHDGLDQLVPARASLAFYPDDVWRYQLASLWQRIGQEQPFVGRTGEVGDDLGSRIIAARLARDVLRLTLLYRRQYPPYAKWLGTVAGENPHLTVALSAPGWPEREQGLLDAYAELIRIHNGLGMTEPVSPDPLQFHDRPFRVVNTDGIIFGLLDRIFDFALRSRPLFGGVDAMSDNADMLCDPATARSVARVALSG